MLAVNQIEQLLRVGESVRFNQSLYRAMPIGQDDVRSRCGGIKCKDFDSLGLFDKNLLEALIFHNLAICAQLARISGWAHWRDCQGGPATLANPSIEITFDSPDAGDVRNNAAPSGIQRRCKHSSWWSA
jgi:hypothetical protein